MAPKTSTTDKNLIWSSKMDDALIDAYMNELNIGNKVNGNFTPTAYNNITQYLSALFGFQVDKEKVKNRWKTLKKNFSEIYDIFKGGMSGFSWNSSTTRWEAEDQVWDQLIEVKPKAALWRNTPLPNYEKIISLYGNDQANGEGGDTPSNMKKRRRSNPHEFVEAVNEVDHLTSQNEVTLEGFSINMENLPLDDHAAEANSESSKRTKRSATSKDKDPFQLQLIADKMEFIAEALSEGNKIFKDRYVPQISGEETLKMIVDAGCEEDKISKIYCSVMNDVSKLRAVIECPPPLRKQVIMDMVFGY